MRPRLSRGRIAARAGALLAAPLLALALLASGCGKPDKLPPLAPDAVLLAFGDSLTYGTGANESESYPAHLEKLIGRRVVREGVPGEVSEAGLARLPAALDEHRPRLLLLCHGGNDFLQRLPKARAAENLRAMIRLAKSRGVDVLLIGTPEPGITVTAAAFYGEIAKEFRVPYEGEVLGKILKDNSLKSDQVHPNALGYRLMAERVGDLLRKSGAL
jgi:lysophospholipase L1-like esterase